MRRTRPTLPADTPPWGWYLIGVAEAQNDKLDQILALMETSLEELREFRKAAEQDRKRAQEDRERAELDRREAAADRKSTNQILQVIILQNRELGRKQDETLRLLRPVPGLLRDILHVLRIGLNSRGNSRGNGRGNSGRRRP